MRQKGFTLVELIIAIMLLGILAGTMTLNPSSARQTAKKEAERVTAKLASLIRKADREYMGFVLSFDKESDAHSFDVTWIGGYNSRDESVTASTGCSFKPYKQYLYYNAEPPATGSNTKLTKRFPYIKTVKLNHSVNYEINKDYYYSIDIKGADNKIIHIVLTSGDSSVDRFL